MQEEINLEAHSKNILLVDKNKYEVKVLKNKLQQFGFNITVAEDPVTAVDILANNSNIDLIISEFDLPYLTGFQFLKRISRLKDENRAKVIIKCSGCSVNQLRTIIRSGASDCLIKPIDSIVLQHKISSLLKISKEHWLDYTINDFETEKTKGLFVLNDKLEIISLSELGLGFLCNHKIQPDSQLIIRVPILEEIGVGECLVEVYAGRPEGTAYYYNANIIGLEESKRTKLRQYLLECYRKKRRASIDESMA